MTPEIIGFKYNELYVVEMSKGKGFSTPYIYGVSVKDRQTRETQENLNKLFGNEIDMIDYVQALLRVEGVVINDKFNLSKAL